MIRGVCAVAATLLVLVPEPRHWQDWTAAALIVTVATATIGAAVLRRHHVAAVDRARLRHNRRFGTN